MGKDPKKGETPPLKMCNAGGLENEEMVLSHTFAGQSLSEMRVFAGSVGIRLILLFLGGHPWGLRLIM